MRFAWYAIPMKYMGIDYGTKRIGVALTDDKCMMAFPYAVYANDASILKTIEALAQKEHVEKIVLGHSLGRDGAPNKVHALVEEFMLDLTLNLGLPIELEPEQYTTQEAIRLQGRNEMTDASAASVILNSYLLKIENRK
jgi:putative Holliday junction resolvase